LSNKNLNIKVSGVIYSIDIYKPNSDDAPLSSDFCSYKPLENGSEDCFEFIGVLVDFKETDFLSIPKYGGYFMTVKLIYHPEIKDFFTINMFVSKHSIPFEELKIGMQLTGLVLLQGEIDER